MDKVFRLVVPALAMAVWAFGCGKGSEAPPEDAGPVRGGTLVVGLRTEPDTAHPYLSRAQESLELANRTLPRLWREVLPEPGQEVRFEPELARSYTWEDGGKALRVELVEGATWSDGSPVTCEDLAFTLEAQKDPALGWPAASIKKNVAGVECPAPGVAVYRFDTVTPDRLMDVNDIHVLPRSLAAIPRDQWRQTDWTVALPAAGPFTIASWQRGVELVLTRHEKYWGAPELPRLERVVLRAIPETVAAQTALLTGDVDVLASITPDTARMFAEREGFTVVRRPGWHYVYMGHNAIDPAAYRAYRERRERECARAGDQDCLDDAAAVAKLARERPHPILGDARVRLALTLAIDRRLIIDTHLSGEAEIPPSPILAPLPAHDPGLAPWEHDPERALALLAEAGFTDSDGDGLLDRGGKKLALTLFTQAGNALRENAAVMVKQDLAAIGVDVTLRPLPGQSFYPELWKRGMDLWIGRWRVPARVDMTELLHANACGTGGANFGCWTNEQADALAARAIATVDDLERAQLWHQWELAFHDEQPYTILFRAHEMLAARDAVRGVESSLANDSLNGLETWWLDPARGKP